MISWNENVGFEGAAWIDAGRQAVVFSGFRPRGEEWYGGENGYASIFCDYDYPRHYGEAVSKQQNTTERVPCLFSTIRTTWSAPSRA